MRKVAILLVLALLFSFLGLVQVENQKIYAANKLGNVEVTANNLNVRQDKSTNSKILAFGVCKRFNTIYG
jgi:hypothetical protein